MNPTPRTRLLTSMAVLGIAVLGLAACGDDESSSSDGEIAIVDAWARTSPVNAANGAAFMVIVSPVDDALLSAAVDASIAAKVELHETVAVETMPTDTSMTPATGMSDTTMPGTTMPGSEMMEMRPVEKIVLEAETPVALQPGGYHIMLLDLAAPLETGSTIELTLTFETAGTKVVQVPVRDTAP